MIITKKIKGGHKFKRFTGQPSNELIDAGVPEKVIIPLKQGFGNEVEPVVSVGDKVKAGQIIGRNDDVLSSPVHSSVSGTVGKISSINYFRQQVRAVEVNSDSNSSWQAIEGHRNDWEKLSAGQMEKLLYLSGVSALDRSGIPTGYKSSVISPQQAEDIIIHGVGSEVYNLSPDVLLEGKKFLNFLEGIKILRKIMPSARFHLAFGSQHPELARKSDKFFSDDEGISVYSLDPVYPQGYDEIIIPTLTGKKFPYGYSSGNIGVIVLNIQAVIQVYEAVSLGKPLIERIVALCGPGFEKTLHAKVRVGTPLEFLLKDRLDETVSSRVVLNSSLTGVELNDLILPVNRAFSHIIALDNGKERDFLSFIRPGKDRDSFSNCFAGKVSKLPKKAHTSLNGERRPCIFCNYCQQVCPVDIIPHYIYHHVERGYIDQTLLRFAIFNCIECNLCSYVCPSKIPLAGYIKEGMESLIDQGCDHTLMAAPYMDLKGLEEYRGFK